MSDKPADDLEGRVRKFMCLELPGQMPAMHMGTSYLVQDLWKEVRRLRKVEQAAEDVCAFDWSENDDDAVRTIHDLRQTLPSAND